MLDEMEYKTNLELGTRTFEEMQQLQRIANDLMAEGVDKHTKLVRRSQVDAVYKAVINNDQETLCRFLVWVIGKDENDEEA